MTISKYSSRENDVFLGIVIASKFIRRTIPHAEYWITNRHRWMHNIPTEVYIKNYHFFVFFIANRSKFILILLLGM